MTNICLSNGVKIIQNCKEQTLVITNGDLTVKIKNRKVLYHSLEHLVCFVDSNNSSKLPCLSRVLIIVMHPYLLVYSRGKSWHSYSLPTLEKNNTQPVCKNQIYLVNTVSVLVDNCILCNLELDKLKQIYHPYVVTRVKRDCIKIKNTLTGELESYYIF